MEWKQTVFIVFCGVGAVFSVPIVFGFLMWAWSWAIWWVGSWPWPEGGMM